MNNLFDYVFYRVSRVFFKWDGRSGFRGVLALSMIQTISTAVCALIVGRVFFEKRNYTPHSKLISYIGLAIFVVLCLYNDHRYKNKYHLLKIRWKAETRSQYFYRGMGVVLVLLVPWVLLIVISTFF
jgi:hypothetical protein